MTLHLNIDADGRRALPHDALVVVCDSEHVRFLKNSGTAAEPKLEQFTSFEQPNPSAGDQVSDRPGRFNDGSGPQRSAVAEPDHHELEKQRFAQTVADMLYRALEEDGYQDLVLVAAPAVLGELRQRMHAQVRERMRGELDKNLCQHSVPDIQRILLTS